MLTREKRGQYGQTCLHVAGRRADEDMTTKQWRCHALLASRVIKLSIAGSSLFLQYHYWRQLPCDLKEVIVAV
jgi:hypothetical protein